MDRSIWNQLRKQRPLKPVSSNKYAQLVDDSTQQLHQSLESILSALDERALGLAKCANFDAALGDANVLQHMLPSSAVGYLRAAMIYSEQGKQRHVVDICNQGLENVDPTDPHYDSLQRTKADAEQRANKRIDFISQLPVDIVVTKLIPLLMQDTVVNAFERHPYMSISNQWRDRIMQCFGGLRVMVDQPYDRNRDRYSQVAQLSQNTETMYIEWSSEGTWFSDLLCDNDFGSLRKLIIRDFSSNHIAPFVSSLKSIGNNLTCLTVIQEEGSKLSLADIVPACPNLSLLSMEQPYHADLSSLPMTPLHNMTALSIMHATNAITCDQVVEIWKRCPALEELKLHPCTDIQSALMVSEYRPSVTRLELDICTGRIALTYFDQGQGCEENGIIHLSIYGYSRNAFMGGFNCKDLVYLLKNNQRTLTHLLWNVDIDVIDDSIYNIQFPNLKKLVLHQPGWWILRNAPMLEYFQMSQRVIRANNQVLDTVPPHLQKLTMPLHIPMPLDDKKAIEDYLYRVAQQSQLKKLLIYFNSMDNVATVLDAVCHLHQLEHLTITFTKSWDAYQMERFLDKLSKSCPRLACLETRSENAPSTYSMNALKRLEHLTHFTFSVDCTDGNDGFWNAILTFSQLKSIRIYPATAVTPSILGRLKEQRPDMKILVNKPFTQV
ncbi:hypothetical protein K492DRAFT_211655 [Lichtheimia hyalospora FSU 10163]|nr:hypothetical protein K492DRAFT_211655 [Lichtheimia hyalospora FSU 10163]